MKVEGSCLCGAIAFEAEVDPDKVSICHCLDCQVLSGAPYRASVPVKAEDLTFLHGIPKTYVKTAESGNKRVLGFCGDCGSPFYSTSADTTPALYMVRVGSIRQRDQLVPKKQIWRQSALGWIEHLDEMESFAKSVPQK